jgi:hypothetical protein
MKERGRVWAVLVQEILITVELDVNFLFSQQRACFCFEAVVQGHQNWGCLQYGCRHRRKKK